MTNEEARPNKDQKRDDSNAGMRFRAIGSKRVKLLAAFMVIALVPLLVFAFINQRSTIEALNTGAYRSLNAAASLTASRLSEFIKSNLEVIGAESRLPVLAKYLDIPRVLVTFGPLREECRGVLASLAEKNPVFINSYGLIGPDGFVLVDTRRDLEGWSVAQQEYFKQAMNTGMPCVQDVDYVPEYGQAFIHFASPVLDEEGHAIGVLRGTYNVAVLQQMLVRDLGIAREHSSPMLVDALGRILAFGRLSHLSLGTYLLEPLQSLTSGGRGQQLAFRRALETSAPASRRLTARFRFSGDSAEAVAMAELPEMDWRVLFLQPEEVFLAPASRQANGSRVSRQPSRSLRSSRRSSCHAS